LAGELALGVEFVAEVVQRVGLAVMIGGQRGSGGGYEILIAAQSHQDRAGEGGDLGVGWQPDAVWPDTSGRDAFSQNHR
jgi:hypothetical protein